MLRLSHLAEKARSIAGIDFLDTARIPRNRRPRCGGGIGGREPRSRASRNQRHALEPERKGSPAFNPGRLSIVLCLSLVARDPETNSVHRRPFSEVARPWDRICPGKRLRKTAPRPRLRVCTHVVATLTSARRDEAAFIFVARMRQLPSLSPFFPNERKIAFGWPPRDWRVPEFSSTRIFSRKIYTTVQRSATKNHDAIPTPATLEDHLRSRNQYPWKFISATTEEHLSDKAIRWLSVLLIGNTIHLDTCHCIYQSRK